MRLTKLGHACVRLEKGGANLVIDPGVWSGPDALSGASAILITHEHVDHLDAPGVLAALAADPGLQVWANAAVAAQLADAGNRVHVVGHGDTFSAAGFDIGVYGQQHAVIHRDIPVIANCGFVVDGEVFHPGDALTVPEDRVATLLLPANAPWLKVSEMIDYAREVAPRRAYAIHDGLLNANGLGLMRSLLKVAAAPAGAQYARLEPGTTVEIEPMPARELSPDWNEMLRAEAAAYAGVALVNITREFPVMDFYVWNGPDDIPGLPRDATPVFYGSFDWHSCVEMHWLLVRLMRVAGDAVPASAIKTLLNEQFSAAGLAAEAAAVAGRTGAGQRPYGWGWALALVHETSAWDDPDARRWSAAMAPFAEALTERFLRWLPKATYPVRHGLHPNSAFGMSRALPYAAQRARAGDPALLDAITAKARAWFGADTDYPGRYEPSGHDFLSPALTEAELMARVLPQAEFPAWLERFLPGIVAGEPTALFTPAVVSDSSDGQIAHLHGLNASRAWCWRRIAESLPAGDPRIGPALAAASRHADASLPHVVGDDYAVEHWLACYAVLLLS